MKNKKTILVIILLLLAALLCYFLCNKKSNVVLPVFKLQGSSTIGAGNIEMKIWDNNTEDGDTVNVFFKDELIIDTLALDNDPLVIQLGKLRKGEYQLGVSTINEGMASPATCTISLSNGTEEVEFVMDSWIDSASSWKVIVN